MTETLYLLIPLSVVLVFLIGLAFWWSLRNGQFDDMEGPAYRILMDDDSASPPAPESGTGARQEAQSGQRAKPSSATNVRDS
jgi:cbb3-type cytochrome oxidase maturation protein